MTTLSQSGTVEKDQISHTLLVNMHHLVFQKFFSNTLNVGPNFINIVCG